MSGGGENRTPVRNKDLKNFYMFSSPDLSHFKECWKTPYL